MLIVIEFITIQIALCTFMQIRDNKSSFNTQTLYLSKLLQTTNF